MRMRFKCTGKRYPKDGTIRIKTKFLFIPKCIDGETRWLEKASYKQQSRMMRDMTTGSEWLQWLNIEWIDEASVGVVMASAGYPGTYRKDLPITGLDKLDEDILVFHAGTVTGPQGGIYTDGGRVLTVVALGSTVAEARDKVYSNLPRLHFEGCYYRRDIAATGD